MRRTKKPRKGGGATVSGKIKKLLTGKNLTVLFAFFVFLSLVAIAGLYIAHSSPVEETQVTTLASYLHDCKYNYIAGLKPSKLYENKSTLGPGEGTLYINIVENVDFTFSYRFICNRPASITTEYSVSMDVESPGKWVKSFDVIPENSISSSGGTIEFSIDLPISVSWFEGVKGVIDAETGTSSSSYNLRIKPSIRTVAVTDVSTIDNSLAPELVVSFNYGGAGGNQITMDSLESTSPGTIQETETIYHEDVSTHRNISYAVAAVAFAGLICTGWLFMRARPKRPEKLVEEMIEPFKEAVVEVAKRPSYKGQATTIAVKSLDDLAYLAGGLGKPVLYLRKGQVHTFYVLDGPVRYEYSFKLPSKVK